MKPYKDLVTGFVRSWNYARGESLDLLDSLDNGKLLYKPDGNKWQSIAYQFGCMARTQMVYTRSIKEGRMNYKWFHDPSLMGKNDIITKKELDELLDRCDKEWNEVIREKRREEDFVIAWPGFNMGLLNHISALISHERLHHGQLISYFTLADFELPKRFKEGWSL